MKKFLPKYFLWRTPVTMTGKWQMLFANGFSLLTKFTELTFLLPTSQPTIICLTETWLTPSVSEPEVSPDSYSLFSKWPCSAPSGRWSGYVGKIVPAYSPCDRCDQPTWWNGGLSIFPSLTSYHGVTRLQKPILNRIRQNQICRKPKHYEIRNDNCGNASLGRRRMQFL